MLIHHNIALVLSSFAWICQMHRIGIMTIVLNHCSHTFLTFAKTLKHAKYQKAVEFVFALFTISWIITRIFILPQIFYATISLAEDLPSPALTTINCLLLLLLVLNVFWTYLIFLSLVQILKGQNPQDARSSSSELSDNDGKKE